jgi:hypothetical protein
MFDQILGLPAHPLIIHAAVVFTPLLALLSIAYAVLPGWHRRLGWAVVVLAVVAPGAVFAARESGQALANHLFGDKLPSGSLGQRVATHESFATPLLLSTIGLGVLSLLLVYASTRAAGPAADPERAEPRHVASRSAGRTTVTMVLSVATIVVALVVLYYVLRAGDSGARAVWGG